MAKNPDAIAEPILHAKRVNPASARELGERRCSGCKQREILMFGKAKVNKDFHLRSNNITQLLSVPHDRDKTYFDNVQFEHLLNEFVSREELNETVVNTGTIPTNPMKARDLT